MSLSSNYIIHGISVPADISAAFRSREDQSVKPLNAIPKAEDCNTEEEVFIALLEVKYTEIQAKLKRKTVPFLDERKALLFVRLGELRGKKQQEQESCEKCKCSNVQNGLYLCLGCGHIDTPSKH